MTKEPEIKGERLYVFDRHCFFTFIQDERLCPELEHAQHFNWNISYTNYNSCYKLFYIQTNLLMVQFNQHKILC